MMTIPFESKSAKYQGLSEVTKRTARSYGCHEAQVQMMMTYFFEHLADVVGKGELVRIPGFGAFGAYWWVPRKADRDSYARPGFSPSRSFANVVCFQVQEEAATEAGAFLRRHRNNHHPTSVATSPISYTWKTMSAYRDRLHAQWRGLGVFD